MSEPKELIILGKGPSRVECLYDKEVWAVNDSYDFALRIDKLFLTDAWTEFSIKELKRAQKKYGCEIVASTLHPDLKVTVFPIEEVLSTFRTTFFSNTICYELAYALLLGYTKIWFYGIDMMSHTTYVLERGAVEFWMGVAKGMGVEIVNTKNSATAKTFNGKLYGYWGEKEGSLKEIIKTFKHEGLGKNVPFWVDAYRREVNEKGEPGWITGIGVKSMPKA